MKTYNTRDFGLRNVGLRTISSKSGLAVGTKIIADPENVSRKLTYEK